MEPRIPTHSLPSYNEPTPETRARVSREEEAERALKHTRFSKGAREILLALFLLTIVSVSAIQFLASRRAPNERLWPRFGLETFFHAKEIKSFEKQLETDSVVSQWLLPPTQSILTGKFGAGNEQVYLGRDGWLFYRPDVDYVTGPPFLDATQLRRRAHSARIQPDPIKAIVQFHEQLAARGIALVVLPVPVKASVDGEMLSARVSLGAELQNASFADFKTRLTANGVRLFDPAPALVQRKRESENWPLYLQSDTHWRPETMEFVTRELAAFLKLPAPQSSAGLQVSEKQLAGVGDIARMLKLPPNEQLYPAQEIVIRQVTSGSGFWRPSADADVLLLGDSFANIFSLEALGWGESAGFAEQLSHS
ncbi:MAG: alginate O-acetyltransferase AlgX-related protein [Chthoniobacterales bacterium]